MSKHIVILSGSPRKKGNTEQLVAAFKAGAESAGKTVTVFQTAHMDIAACTGCEYCITHPGGCALKDDMGEIIGALHRADVIVWASPVYYFSFTAQLKRAIDRMYPLINEASKQAALLLTCAEEDTDTAAGAFAIYERILNYYEWENAGTIIASGVEHMGDIAGHHALVKAQKLGREI
ncbi:MAG: flavodoxin family protein [Oscillospiraceae bacterium]|nr:flavodoxin family protein [Oscillospiraceae bacterium]